MNYLLKLSASLIILSSPYFISSCVIYKSPERKDFESEYATFNINNLKLMACSSTSVITRASSSRLVYVHQNQTSMWEHIVDGAPTFESNNFQGEFCIYEYSDKNS